MVFAPFVVSKLARWFGLTVLMALPAVAIATANWFNRRVAQSELAATCACCHAPGPLQYEEVYTGRFLFGDDYTKIGPFCADCCTKQLWRNHADFARWAEHLTRAQDKPLA